jgi:hypothetical protein
MTSELKSKRYQTLKKEVTDGKKVFEKVGHALAEIRDSKLYLEEYDTFEECLKKEWDWSARRGYQLIEASSIDAKQVARFDLTAKSAVELAKVPKEERQEVLEQVEKEDGKVTAAAIKKKGMPKRIREEKICDKTGLEIPAESLELWNRGNEQPSLKITHTEINVFELRAYLILCKKNLEARQENNDPLYREIDYTGSIANLNQVIEDIGCAIPHAICHTCNGKRPATCDTCKGRGFVSEFFYKTCVPEEFKKLRVKK